MSDPPEILAETPTIRSREVLEGDALSEALHSIRLRGHAVSLHRGRGLDTPDLETDVRAIHVMESGTCVVDGAGVSPAIVIAEGELALLPLGSVHSLTGGSGACWVSGIFEVDDVVAEPFLSTLPPVIVVRGGDRERSWLRVSLDLLRQELIHPQPGGRVMVSRILDLLFVHALREWVDSGEPSPGLLTAALDPAVGRALARLHENPAHPWSVAELASIAHLSRSGFAARFSLLAGLTPAAYLAKVRLDVASSMLLDTDRSLGNIAREVGYASEAGFSRAFRRRFGTAPGVWRRAQGN